MTNHIDLDGIYFSKRQLLARGGIALVVVLLVTSWLLAKSMGYLDRGVQVVADLRNIGDGLPAGSDVKYRGIQVGTVESLDPSIGNQPNQVRIRLKPEYAASIPVTVTARVVPSNVFAVSSIQLVEHGPGTPISDGERISEDTDLPTVLFQTALTKLRDILAAAGRNRDDHTLGVLAAVGAATNNRNGALQLSTHQLIRIIDELNGVVATDEGPSTVAALVDAARGLSQSAPELLDALHDAVAPMRTLVDKQQALHDFLGAGQYTTGLAANSLQNHSDQLVQITTDLTPVVGVFADNAQHFVPITERITRFSDKFFEEVWDPASTVAHGRVNVSFTPSYTYTRADCPRYGELRAPSCFAAPLVQARPDLPEVLLPQNYQPPPNLAPPPGTVVGPDGNLVAVGPPLINPTPNLEDPNPPLPAGVTPAPPVPGTANPDLLPAAPSSFGGNVGPVGSVQERAALSLITGEQATVATQLLLGPVARGAIASRTQQTPTESK
ncbi:MlaD family protein [Mycobacterium ulcerans]|uniref:MlaD family protein n=1 Tax=Mycobacterium ulcerans TaxID=1809 RepID=UPI0012DDBE4A|nr:MlaD family protein [Mycobacterium ulcerans]MEB3968967.1 MlaD family protein [Mycobacterium ulcerans]MEB3977173.1 MlaD family protein [Mycobacterium ulcerans]MEB4006580.1 MlaD family protein [Mycobacterium ulcerans]MEB4416089.1 MlaD family protein [Mycobacterium ulcerans]MEB4434277.1 MlaD family protein [Mycobacterium ulcerans]